MADSLDDNARAAATALIIAKRDALVSLRGALLDQRAEILTRLRRVDRELADCRAAARLFSLEIEFPAEDRVELDREMVLREHREAVERMRREQERLRTAATLAAASNSVMAEVHPDLAAALTRPVTPHVPTRQEALPIVDLRSVVQSAAPAPRRPPIREIVLSQLQAAGAAGSKAAVLRDYIERTYGAIVHEKTVGMTLYRLLKEGQVRRDGHTWFFAPALPGTENPGAGTPGLDNSDTEKGDQHHAAHGP